MNIKEAVAIISKEAPCRHDSFEECGVSNKQGRCCDCGAFFEFANSHKHIAAADKFDAAIDFILSFQTAEPKPKTETKEVKIYASMDSTTGRIWNVGTKEDMEIAVSPDPNNLIKIVELTGTYEATVKPKVKRREVMGTFYTGYDAFCKKGDKGIPGDAALIFEWEE